MRFFRHLVLAAVLASPLAMTLASPAFAGDDPVNWDCQSLWSSRNQIYKSGGYCFRTARAIRAFGNGGCRFDDIRDVPLSANDRSMVAEITRAERIKGCPR